MALKKSHPKENKQVHTGCKTNALKKQRKYLVYRQSGKTPLNFDIVYYDHLLLLRKGYNVNFFKCISMALKNILEINKDIRTLTC